MLELTAVGVALCATLGVANCQFDKLVGAWHSSAQGRFMRVYDSRVAGPLAPSYVKVQCEPFPIAEQKFDADTGAKVSRFWFPCRFD